MQISDKKDRSTGTLATQVYEELVARIQKGALAHDTRLVDTTLAEELSISRMPIREALLRLTHEGYLVGTTRGFMLPKLTTTDFREIWEVRRLLEPRAAALAARAMTAEQLSRMETAHQAALASHEDALPTFMEANRQFRRTWIEAIPNSRLAATILRFVDHVQVTRDLTYFDIGTRRFVMEMLTKLLGPFMQRDALAVNDQMTLYVDRASELFFSMQKNA